MSSESMKPSPRILLCSDLDRTLLPNGQAPESVRARPLLRRLAQRIEVMLAYVSGRHRALIQEAIEQYELPEPAMVVGDVGTTIYEITGGQWVSWDDWDREIAVDWKGTSREDLAALLSDIQSLSPQEPEKQNRYKLSYYVDLTVDAQELVQTVETRLAQAGLDVSVIWSVDDQNDVGLLDVLPRRATKLHAVRFLSRKTSVSPHRVVYAGDSGNDMAVLISDIRSVLVRNASDSVRREAREKSRQNGTRERLYLCQGGFFGMNGNYAAGVLEGLAHFFPQTAKWLQASD